MDPVAILAVVVGFLALGVSCWVGVANQKHNRLSVRPYLAFNVDLTGSADYVGIRLHNAGFGPAIIRHIILSINGNNLGEATYKAWVEAKKRLGINYDWVEFTEIPPGCAIASGQSKNIFCLKDPAGNAQNMKLFTGMVPGMNF